MRRRINKDSLTGSLFILFGALWLYIGSTYPLGTALRMGPGYFPMILSAGLVLVGVAILVRAQVGQAALRLLGWRQALATLGGAAAFAGVESLGLAIATLLVVLISALAKPGWAPLNLAIFSLAVMAFSIIVFQKLLGMTIPVWPTF